MFFTNDDECSLVRVKFQLHTIHVILNRQETLSELDNSRVKFIDAIAKYIGCCCYSNLHIDTCDNIRKLKSTRT